MKMKYTIILINVIWLSPTIFSVASENRYDEEKDDVYDKCESVCKNSKARFWLGIEENALKANKLDVTLCNIGNVPACLLRTMLPQDYCLFFNIENNKENQIPVFVEFRVNNLNRILLKPFYCFKKSFYLENIFNLDKGEKYKIHAKYYSDMLKRDESNIVVCSNQIDFLVKKDLVCTKKETVNGKCLKTDSRLSNVIMEIEDILKMLCQTWSRIFVNKYKCVKLKSGKEGR